MVKRPLPVVSDETTDRALKELERRLDDVDSKEYTIVSFTPVAATAVRVPHPLKRKYKHAIGLDGTTVTIDRTKARQDKEIWLTASGYGSATTVYAWVF